MSARDQSGYDDSDSLLAAIADLLTRPDTIIFVGSGISRWSGLPDWSTLLKHLAEFVDAQGGNSVAARRTLDKGDLLLTAGYLVDQINSSELGRFLREECQYGIAKPHSIHRIICELGPSCFITTNYDTLLEDQLRHSRRSETFHIVTNRHLAELADIQKARASHFVFKPHGDLTDVESIVLSQSQYDRLLHANRHIPETLKTLLVTRPILFVGYGLRDPDFHNIQSLLQETFRGNAGEHFALMPDINEQEREYWRRNMGIRICSYSTRSSSGHKSADHSELIDILNTLAESTITRIRTMQKGTEDTKAQQKGLMFDLARHGARLKQFSDDTVIYPLRAHFEQWVERRVYPNQASRLHNAPLTRLLQEYDGSLILSGEAGSGKTHALRQYISKCGERLMNDCLEEGLSLRHLKVPIFLDLKLFDGNLQEFATRTLPETLNLENLSAIGKLCFVLDGINEIPASYLEDGRWRKEFDELYLAYPEAQFIVSARNHETLSDLKLPTFVIKSIDETYINEYLQRHNIQMDNLNSEVMTMLCKPLLLRIATDHFESLHDINVPTDLFNNYLKHVQDHIREITSYELDLGILLPPLAFRMIDEGREFTGIQEFIDLLLDYPQKKTQLTPVAAKSVLNSMVSAGLLNSQTGGRLSFFHQSVTEFLAAKQLATRYLSEENLLDYVLKNRRWDYTLLLAADLLGKDNITPYIRKITRIDAALALRATKFVEFNQSHLRSIILETIVISPPTDSDVMLVAYELEKINFSTDNLAALHNLATRADSLGGAAAAAFIKLATTQDVRLYLKRLIECEFDYNYLNYLGETLASRLNREDVEYMIRQVCKLDLPIYADHGDVVQKQRNIIWSIERVLQFLDASLMENVIKDWRRYRRWLQGVIAFSLRERESNTFRRYLNRFVEAKIPHSAFSLFFNLQYIVKDKKRAVPNYTERRLRIICTSIRDEIAIKDGQELRWYLELLRLFCSESSKWRRELNSACQGETDPYLRLIFEVVSTHSDEQMAQIYAKRFLQSDDPVTELDLELLKITDDFNWYTHKELLLMLFKRRDAALAFAILYQTSHLNHDASLNLDIGDTSWWLLWLIEIDKLDPDKYLDFSGLFGRFLAHHTDLQGRHEFVRRLNDENSPFRIVIAKYIISYLKGITTDNLTEDSSNLLIDIHLSDNKRMLPLPSIGSLVTEKFVEAKLLPLLQVRTRNEAFIQNLKVLLKQAGKQHARRYE